MTDAQVKHSTFALIVREHGVAACLSTPESATTFLLTIAEAFSNGFFTYLPTSAGVDS